MNGYSYFAEFYDSLTYNVNYHKMAIYILKLLKAYHHKSGIVLDLACGTGSLTIELKKMGLDVYGVDSSFEMLSKAKQKAEKEKLDILFLCQDMRELDLYGTVDTVICSLDGVNHLTEYEDVQKTFSNISLFLNEGGYFIFDVNTPYKHKYVLANNTFVYDERDVFCVWQNAYEEESNIVDIYLDFFQKVEDERYIRYSESFAERAYSEGEIENILNNANMEIVDVFVDQSFDRPKNDDEKIVYITRKK